MHCLVASAFSQCNRTLYAPSVCLSACLLCGSWLFQAAPHCLFQSRCHCCKRSSKRQHCVLTRGITQERRPRSLPKEKGTRFLGEGPLVNLSASGCRRHPGNTSHVMFRGNMPLCHLSSSPGRQDSPTSSIRHCSGAP